MQTLPELKMQSHPVTGLGDSMSPAASGADSLVWDLDDELPPSPLGNIVEDAGPSSHPADADSSAGASDSREQGTDSSQHPHSPSEPHLSRFAPQSRSTAAGEAVPVMPYAKRRGTWVMILLEAALLLSVVAAFLVLQKVKSQHNKCTVTFAALYGSQVSDAAMQQIF